ncbi:transporter substrate-binding domain-containing protein [Pseudoalteromonas rubra]|uniref:Transporter substrate-binding domain-containing protein n=2 Tax=Pseudoalteromonas rubra TaxID=43658 RepID=A0A5S3UZ59_9GAMM|nr:MULTISPECIES: transporter substrate-binding domain-containing protein [Pseudoalteromonas]MEC4091758.1 transporter substrate-binding domain-containing protein [Pseudoalteromonas rubra]QPB81607.1 transporter substrate-binding domain-containing protein [Pseudoalteromonas rubra]
MKYFIFALFYSFTLSAETVHITTGQWPPYVDRHREDQGCTAQLIRDAFALHGIRVRFVFMPWQRAYEEGKKTEFIGSAYWYYNEKRATEYLYTSYPLTSEVSHFYHLDSIPFKFNSYADLKPFRLLINKGLTYPKTLWQAIKEYEIEVMEATYTTKNLQFLLRQRADIVVLDEQTEREYAKALSNSEVKRLVRQPKPAFVNQGFLLINQHNEKYVALFNNALQTLISNKPYLAQYQENCSAISTQ